MSILKELLKMYMDFQHNGRNMEKKEETNKMHEILGSILEIKGDELQTFLDDIKKSKKKYLVCVDMGCGGTSVAALNLDLGVATTQTITWSYRNAVNLIKDTKTYIPTIIGYDGNKVIIGPEALLVGRAAENFKKIPTEENLKSVALRVRDFVGNEYVKSLREVWGDYFRKILTDSLTYVRKTYPDCSQENVLFVVAHPASTEWIENDILRNYKNMICEGTGLENTQVLTISEAKAAMQYARKLNNLNVDWDKGVIVIDLGASTIDIEYLSKTNPDPEEWSITMAGKEVDYLLVYYILSECFPEFKERFPQMDDFLDDETFWQDDDYFEELTGETRADFMFYIRTLKELICNKKFPFEVERFDKTFSFVADTPKGIISMSNLVSLEELIQNTEFTFDCADFKMASYMNQNKELMNFQSVKGTWYSHLEGIVSFALNELQGENRTVRDIIVTGGTSQLVGIEKHIKAGIEASTIDGKEHLKITMLSSEEDYERTVPYGTIYYVADTLKHIEDMEKFPETLRKILDDEIIGKKKLTKHIATSVSGLAKNAVGESLHEWYELSKNHSDSSLNGLDRIMKKKMQNISNFDLKCKVEEGIRNFGQQQKMSLENVYKEINDFLVYLSQGQYTHSLNVQDVKLVLDSNQIAACVQTSLQGIDCDCLTYSLMGVLSGMWSKFINVFQQKDKKDIQWGYSYRRDVKENFFGSSQDRIQDDLENIIHDELKKTYMQQNRFNLDNQIVEQISDDIKRALYLS